MNSYLKQACEEVDAAILTGDPLYDEEQRQMLMEYLGRWLRAIQEYEQFTEEVVKK